MSSTSRQSATSRAVQTAAATDRHEEHRGPVIILPTIRSHEEIRKRLDLANRRGRLPEVKWLKNDTFRIELPSRPLVTYLLGRLVQGSQGPCGSVSPDSGQQCDLHLMLVPRRRVLYAYLLFLIVSVVVGTPLTDLFWPWMKIWWWGFPLGILSVLWVGVRWPRASSSDAQTILPDWIGVIRQWLENGEGNGKGSIRSSSDDGPDG